MIRRALPVLFLLFLFLSCGKNKSNVVEWQPEQPKGGDVVQISFWPANSEKIDSETDSVFIVYQLQNKNQKETWQVSMARRKGGFVAEIETEPEFVLLHFKFEDNQDRVEDNSGKRWTVFLLDTENNVQKNSHSLNGENFNRIDPSHYAFGRLNAISEFKKELDLFPDNYNVWFDLWHARLMNSEDKQSSLKKIHQQYDSLKTIASPTVEWLHLAFRANSMLLRNATGALEAGEKILSDYSDYPQVEEIELSMIYLKHGRKTERLISELTDFAGRAKNSDVLRTLNYQLGSIFQQQRDVNNSIKYFRKVIELDKNDIAVRMSLAIFYTQLKDYDLAQKMIREAEVNCSGEKFVQTNPWDYPSQRRSWMNLNRCQILSTRAALNFEQGEFEQAIKNRTKAIHLGTPFPAFEWTKIGETYQKMNETGSAKIAYLKAVSINSEQEDAVSALKDIYNKTGESVSNFASWLKEEVEKTVKADAKMAPNFQLTDIEGNQASLTEQNGRVVVLTFWDSWSRECRQELPQLNSLAGQFSGNGNVIFWAISSEAPVSIKKFIRNNSFNFRLFHSGYDVKKMYEIIGVPTHIIIDKTGKIRFTHIGFSGDIKIRLQQEIQLLLDEGEIS